MFIAPDALRASFCAYALIALAACSTSSSSLIPPNQFTPREDLRSIASKPAPSDVLPEAAPGIERWELAGPFPIAISHALMPVEDEWNRLLADAIGGASQAKATRSAHCIAREVGRFYAQHGAAPERALEAFMRRRCGSAGTAVASSYLSYDLKEGESFDPARAFAELKGETRAHIVEQIEAFAKSGPAEIGIWAGEHASKGIVSIVMTPKVIEIEPISMTARDRLIIKGKVLAGRADQIHGSITKGRFGYEPCVTNPSVEFPAFSITCPVVASDKKAVFGLGLGRETSVMQRTVFDQVIWPAGSPSNTYEPSAVDVAIARTTVPDAGSIDAKALGLINAVRTEAKLEPLALAPEQSTMNRVLTPHLFEAMKGDDDNQTNDLITGMMAGWEVKIPLVDGDFYMHSSQSGGVSELVAHALGLPGGRATLLDPRGALLAVGDVSEQESLGAIFTVYEPYQEEPYKRQVARVWVNIDRARKLQDQRKFKKSARLMKEGETLSKRVTAGKMSLTEASEVFAQVAVESYGVGVSYFVFPIHDLNDFTLNPEIVNSGASSAVVMVAPYKPDGYPWWVYGVVVAMPQGGAPVAWIKRSAGRADRSRGRRDRTGARSASRRRCPPPRAARDGGGPG